MSRISEIANYPLGTGACYEIEGHGFTEQGGVLRQHLAENILSSQVADTYTNYWAYSDAIWRQQGEDFNSRQVADCLPGLDQFLSSLPPKVVMADYGCASGFTSRYICGLTKSVGLWVGIDLTLAIDHSIRTMSHFSFKKIFLQADITSRLFVEVFDLVVCNAVLHHLPDPAKGLRMIYDGLKPGGKAVGWVCGDVPPIREFSRSYISSRIRQNSFVEALSVLSPLAALGRDLANYDQRITIKDDVDLLGIKAGEYTLHEFVTKHFLKAFWATSVSPEMATLYNYDEYSPKYQHRLTDLQWFEICQQVGFQEVSVVKSTASGYTLFLKK